MTDEEFLSVYHEHLPAILDYCAFRLGSRQDAEDVAAETFARLLSRGGPESPERVSAWLFAVARNLCTDHERRVQRAPQLQEPPREITEEPVWVDPSVLAALRVLNPSQQQVFFLRAIEDMTFDEIGRRLGRRESAVKMQYHRAVRRARRALEEVESCPQSETETA
jgi:RNA polymerase sigma-70 factor (ECF subfamily)